MKYQFYCILDQDKREIFQHELLNRKNWFTQTLDIVMGTDPKKYVEEFISQSLIESFIKDIDNIIAVKEKSQESGFAEQLFQTLLECSIRYYLNQDTPEAYIQIHSLFHGSAKRERNIKPVNVLENPFILSNEEIAKLNNNLSI